MWSANGRSERWLITEQKGSNMKTVSKSNRRSIGPKRAVASERQSRVEPKLNGVCDKIHVKSILVPIDFSAPSIKAFKYAAAFAEQFSAKLTLVNVIEPIGTPDFSATNPLLMENEQLVKVAESKLAELAREEIDPLTALYRQVLSGKPSTEIVNLARNRAIDLIVIGTHGRTGISHLLLGSTAEQVVRHAPCPVLVVRDQEPKPVQQ